MDNLKVIEHDGIRVLTTKQLAERYGTDPKTISNNFNYKKDKYILGKHYICLTGEEKRHFVDRLEISDGSQNAQTLYLWTEKGAFLVAKSLNTDQAWEAYDKLIDGYYAVKEELVDRSQLSPQMQMLFSLVEQQAKAELEQKKQAERLTRIEEQQEAMKDAFEPIHKESWRKDVTFKFNRIQKACQIPYQELYIEMYKELDRRAGVDTAIRLKNRRNRMREDGFSKTNIDRLTRMDIIENDKKLSAIFERILTDYEIKYCM